MSFEKNLELTKTVKLGDVIEILTDYHANGAYEKLKENVELLDSEDYALMIRTTNFEQNDFATSLKFITKSAYAFLSKSKVYAGDIVMNKIANAGSVYLMPNLNRPVSLAMNLFLIRINETKANPVYVYVYLKVNEAYVKSFANGSVTKTITKEAVRNLELPLPDRKIQDSIASLYQNLNDRIALLRETNATLEAIAQALFKSWFVDFDPVHANAGTQAPSLPAEIQALFPSRLVESPQGLIPEGWEWSTIAQSFILTMGQSPPGDTYNEIGDGLPFYQGKTDYGFRFPTQRVFCTSPTRLAHRGDCLVSVRAPVGDVNVALENCALGRGIAGVRHPRSFTSYVLYTLQLLKPHFEYFNGEGTVFGSINKKDFQNLPVIEAPESVLQAFDEIVSGIDAQIENNELKLRTLVNLRDTLLPRLISGQLRLPEAEAALVKVK